MTMNNHVIKALTLIKATVGLKLRVANDMTYHTRDWLP